MHQPFDGSCGCSSEEHLEARDDAASGEVWPEEVHWSSCDGLCGEPGGCWDDDYDPESPPHDGWGNLVLQ